MPTERNNTTCPACEPTFARHGVAGLVPGATNWVRCKCREDSNNVPALQPRSTETAAAPTPTGGMTDAD